MVILVVDEVGAEPYYPNHTYFLNKSKTMVYAYISCLDGQSKIFSKPVGFSAKGREFRVIKQVEIPDFSDPV